MHLGTCMSPAKRSLQTVEKQVIDRHLNGDHLHGQFSNYKNHTEVRLDLNTALFKF